MDKVIKRKWIRALRSGTYRQARGALYDSVIGGYCCLGVLATVQGKAMPNYRGYLILAEPPRGCRAGISHNDCHRLANMNDGNASFNKRPQSFKQIANWIEKHL